MKAISLHQPHASAMAEGFKTIETRSRLTHVRGDVAICATRKLVAHDKTWDRNFLKWAAEVMGGESALSYDDYIDGLPHGVVLCVVEIIACVPTQNFILESVREKPPLLPIKTVEFNFGNYTAGRWGWMTRNLRKLAKPVPVSGGQFFFNLPPDVERQVKAQL